MLDAMLFTGVGGTLAAPLDWFDPSNWTDLATGANQVPGPSDDVGIPNSAGVVAIGGGLGAEINNIVTFPGSTLIITGGSPQPSELKIDGDPPPSLPPGFPLSPVPGSNYFIGPVIDAGRIIANTTNPNTGTSVFFGGGTIIGPGDLNGNLDAGPNSSFTFVAGGPGVTNTFLAGATLGPGTGSVIIAGIVTIADALLDNTMTMSVVPGGTLGGTGSIDEWANFNWTGGTISLTGGITNEATGNFTATAPPAGLTLTTTLTNESAFMSLGGVGGLTLGPGGSILNAFGNMSVSLPFIASTGGIGITNAAGATLEATTPAGAPTVIIAPFTNNGNLLVDSGVNLTVSGPLVGPSTVALDGVMQLSGNLTLWDLVDSPTDFVEDAPPGFLLVGDPANSMGSTLTVYANAIATVNGNLEVTSFGTLTGDGQVVNSGRLQLDSGSGTAGLGSYQQTSAGTLDVQAAGSGFNSVLTVTGNAQLSGTLEIGFVGGYTPSPGDAFVVVTAGSIGGHFDTIPDGMEETDSPTSVTVTQVDPPAGG